MTKSRNVFLATRIDRFLQPHRQVLVLLAIGAMLSAGPSSHAATAVWVGPAAGGDFQDGANWNLASGLPPQAGDLALIGSVNGTITYSADTAVMANTFFTGNNVTTVLDIGAQTHRTSALFLVGSGGDNQDVEVISGTVNTGTTLLIGSGVGTDDSDVTITGPNTVFRTSFGNSSGGVFVGVGGANSTLTVRQGAQFFDTRPTGGLFGVGLQQTNNGLLTVTDPGTVMSTLGDLQVGSNNDPANPDMFNNQAKVLNGGHLTAGRMLIGVLVSGKQNTVTVSGTDSVLNLTRIGTTSTIGRQSVDNALIIEDNGLVDGDNQFVVGQDATSTGNSVSITTGGRLNGTGLDVRRGTVTITNGSVYLEQFVNNAVNDGGRLVANTGASGSIAFNSGTIETHGAEINNGSAFNVGDGGASSATYRMTKGLANQLGTHSFANGLSLSSNAILAGSGNIVGDVSGAAGAQVNIGQSPGVINTTGAWDNTALQVALEVGNLAAVPALPGVGYDLLDVNGAFSHGGSLNIDVAGYAAGSGFVSDLKIVGWSSEIGNSASTAVNFVGGPALPYAFRADGLYLTNVSYSFVPEPSSLLLVVSGLSLCVAGRRRAPKSL